MHGPAVVGWLLALLCAVTGGYCLALSRRGPAPARATARVEAVMGLGMAAMALPAGAAVLPPESFVVLFGALAGWAAWSARHLARAAHGARRHASHGLHHTLEALAMVYMAVVMLGAEGGTGHGHHGTAGGLPALTGGLLLYFAAFALCTGARLLPAAAGPSAGHEACGVRPRVPAEVCRLTLALGSFTMLLTL